MKWLFAMFIAGPVMAGELNLPPGETLSIEVKPDHFATVTLQDEMLTVSGPEGLELAFEFPDLLTEFSDSDQVGIIEDVNNDGWTDLLILPGLKYNGLDKFYDMLLYKPGVGWQNAGTFSNPVFLKDWNGFLTSFHSGPYWQQEFWLYANGGVPKLGTSQLTTSSGFLLRKEFRGDDNKMQQFLVKEGTRIKFTAGPVRSVVADGGVLLMPNGTASLPAKTRVTGFDFDEKTGWVQIELEGGQRRWVEPDQLVDRF